MEGKVTGRRDEGAALTVSLLSLLAEARSGARGLTTAREADWELVTPSPRSAGQTGADRANVFLLRCAELLNRQQEERPANISFPDRLWMSQSLCGQLVRVHVRVKAGGYL